ncbi:MAG: hypothetical protein JWP29_1942 [Rhodoferax sp.]|nr:hypothetical protein [Rhodoferax sp.]
MSLAAIISYQSELRGLRVPATVDVPPNNGGGSGFGANRIPPPNQSTYVRGRYG